LVLQEIKKQEKGITNTGKVYDGEVAQLYVHKNNSTIKRADKELNGFQKVFLKPNESKVVSIRLDRDAFPYFDEAKNAWAVEPGTYSIQVKGSSRSVRLNEEITIK
jgi:beta-glucosidase